MRHRRFQTRVPDTPENREYFGSSGTADNSSPFPLVRAVVATAAGTRGALGLEFGPSGDGEQTLTRRLVRARPGVFGPGRLFLIDRNFPGFALIAQIRREGAHLLMRVKSDVSLPLEEALPDGSYRSFLTDGRSRIPVRVIEYDVKIPGRDGDDELYALATTLMDWRAYPAAGRGWVRHTATLWLRVWGRAPALPGHPGAGVVHRHPPRGDPRDGPDARHRRCLRRGTRRCRRAHQPAHPRPPAARAAAPPPGTAHQVPPAVPLRHRTGTRQQRSRGRHPLPSRADHLRRRAHRARDRPNRPPRAPPTLPSHPVSLTDASKGEIPSRPVEPAPARSASGPQSSPPAPANQSHKHRQSLQGT